MKIYYVSDRECTLFYRNGLASGEFTIPAPNGQGIFEIEIEELDPSMFLDGNGAIRKAYTEYLLRLNFHYSSHKMDLWRLLQADEIEIPFSFDLKNDIVGRFVLLNKEAIYDFLSGLMIQGVEEEFYQDAVNLQFESVNPFKEEELLGIPYYVEPDIGVPPEGIIFTMTSRTTFLRSLDYNLDIIHSQSVISGSNTSVEAMGTRPDLKVAFNTTQAARYLYQYNKDAESFSLLFTNSTPFARAKGLYFSSMNLNRWFHGLGATSNGTHGSMWDVDPPGLFANIIPSSQPPPLNNNAFTYAAIANGDIPYLAIQLSHNNASYLTRRSIDDLSLEWVVDLPYGFISRPFGVHPVNCIGLRDGGVIVVGTTPSTVIKYNSEGDLIWSFNTGLARNSCLAIERDNSFYVGAATSRVVRKYSAGSSSSDPDLIWEISLGSNGFLDFYPVALASDGADKLIVAGSSGSLVLVDSINGDLINQRTIGGSNENVLQAIAIHPGNLAIF